MGVLLSKQKDFFFLEEGITFTIEKLKEVCKINKSCGEPINLLTITSNGLKRINLLQRIDFLEVWEIPWSENICSIWK